MFNPCDNSCNLISCSCENNAKIDEKQLKIAEFKEKTDKIRVISDKSIKKAINSSKKDENPSKVRKYRLTLSEYGDSDGYYLEYSKELNIFEFTIVLANVFGVDVNVEYDEDSDANLQEDIIFFNSLEDAIEFLENKNRDEQ